jgi:hypothetical protein
MYSTRYHAMQAEQCSAVQGAKLPERVEAGSLIPAGGFFTIGRPGPVSCILYHAPSVPTSVLAECSGLMVATMFDHESG